MNLMVQSPAKVSMEKLTEADAINLMSKGKVRLLRKGRCTRRTSQKMGMDKTLSEYADITKAAGVKTFAFAPSKTYWGAHWCRESDSPYDHDWYNIYEIVDPAKPTVAAAVEPSTAATTPAPVVAPAAVPSKSPVSAVSVADFNAGLVKEF